MVEQEAGLLGALNKEIRLVCNIYIYFVCLDRSGVS